ncbi:MAG TPA: CpsD/CapB family tyrosine-protein kinase [Clostridia bacterium]
MLNTNMYEVDERLNIPAEEAYEVLKTNMQFCDVNNSISAVAITSLEPKVGKTTTSINLALTMVKSGKKVLMVDADMRKPMILKHSTENRNGLSNVISKEALLKDTVTKTNAENLYILHSGSKVPYPAELLSSAAFEEFLGEVKRIFDFVIIDTPSMRAGIDGAIIASKVDGTIIVVDSKEAHYWPLVRMKSQLEKANARILGVVLNKVGRNEYKEYI